MGTVEDEIEGMFDMQREVIAKASLAGCRFELVEDSRRVGGPNSGMKRGWVPFNQYRVLLPSNEYLMQKSAGSGGFFIETIALFEDRYAAACAAVAALEKVELPRGATTDLMFRLLPENEQ